MKEGVLAWMEFGYDVTGQGIPGNLLVSFSFPSEYIETHDPTKSTHTPNPVFFGHGKENRVAICLVFFIHIVNI